MSRTPSLLLRAPERGATDPCAPRPVDGPIDASQTLSPASILAAGVGSRHRPTLQHPRFCPIYDLPVG